MTPLMISVVAFVGVTALVGLLALVLTNQGDAPLTISDIAVNSLDFTLTAGTGPGTLPPGGSREIEVRYTPWNISKRTA